MNAPERIVLGNDDALGSVSICYAPLIDRKRKAVGTRLTMVAARSDLRAPIGAVLEALNTVWPQSAASMLVAPLDATLDESALGWDAPANAILEVSAAALADPSVQVLAQKLFRDGKRLVTDGPFAETKEQLGGYYLIEAADLDEATAIAARIPSAQTGSIEVRPLVVRQGM